MPIRYGSSGINNLKYGSSQVDKLYYGSTHVWPLVGPLTGHTPIASGGTLGSSTCRYYADSDGFIYTKEGTAAVVQHEQWLLVGTNSDYEVRFTQVGSGGSGSLNGTLSTWLGLGTNREINTTTTNGNSYFAGVDVEIREAGTGIVQQTIGITLESEWF